MQATPSITIAHISFILVSYQKIYSLSVNYIVHFIFFPIVFLEKEGTTNIYVKNLMKLNIVHVDCFFINLV